MPLLVVPIFSFPAASSLISSISWWKGKIKDAASEIIKLSGVTSTPCFFMFVPKTNFFGQIRVVPLPFGLLEFQTLPHGLLDFQIVVPKLCFARGRVKQIRKTSCRTTIQPQNDNPYNEYARFGIHRRIQRIQRIHRIWSGTAARDLPNTRRGSGWREFTSKLPQMSLRSLGL